MDVEVSDHTGTVEMKMWTQTMDALLRSCGLDAPERGVTDIEEIEEQIRNKYWSLRCIIVEEAAYQNRSARNRLEVVSIKEQSRSFTGRERLYLLCNRITLMFDQGFHMCFQAKYL